MQKILNKAAKITYWSLENAGFYPITHSKYFVFGFESLSRNSSDIFIALHVKVSSDEHGDKSFKV